MTDPQSHPQPPEPGNFGPPPGYQPPPYQPPQYQSSQFPPPYPGGYPGPGGLPGYDPAAPFGRHPVTGEPFSDKSKTIAGLLQLLGLFGLVGIGRIYLGQTGFGIAQLIVGLATCGIGAVIWGLIDAILILTDKVRDPHGRPLRDGT
ncbi:NINE protein [Mycolicibacterium sp. 22603]|uniref:NINE protein n=1 Tax=Mycolicibacterium sp. 22603 TaxID=3453950 RepID=UPI003F84279C